MITALKPYPKMKDSRVEWLGEVPEHWEVRRLKQVSVVQTGVTLGKNYGDTKLIERPYLRVANVQAGRLDSSKVTTVRIPPSEAAKSKLTPGDVLMTEGGDIDKLGRGCVWRGEISDCLHQNHIFAVRPNLAVLIPEFLVALMGSRHGRSFFQVTAKQTTNLAATNSTTLGNFPLHLPGVAEQENIMDYVAERCCAQETAIDRTRCEIELLSEYRTRLIADVVTGKLNVREAAANLAEETEAADETDCFADNNEALDDDLDAVPEEAKA